MADRPVLYAYFFGWEVGTERECWTIGPDEEGVEYIFIFGEDRMHRAVRLLRRLGWTVVADRPPFMKAADAMRERDLFRMCGISSH